MHKAVQFPTGSQITKRGKKKKKAFGAGMGLRSWRSGGVKEELLVSVNLSDPHTL